MLVMGNLLICSLETQNKHGNGRPGQALSLSGDFAASSRISISIGIGIDISISAKALMISLLPSPGLGGWGQSSHVRSCQVSHVSLVRHSTAQSKTPLSGLSRQATYRPSKDA
jgi:hypothetical protein